MAAIDFLNDENKEELIKRTYEKAKQLNEKHNFMITFNDLPSAYEDFSGLVVSVKDCFTTDGLRTTAGSKMLGDYVPIFDATIVKRLKDKGAYILGKTAMDEFGFGTFSLNCAFGAPKNALDVERVAGGSSGGAGVATQLLKDHPHVALAESTGGSISNPAAFNGVFSLTPTYGLLSRYGLIDYANTLDKPGVIASSMKDIAFVMDAIKGRDVRDATSQEYIKGFMDNLSKQKVKKLGIINSYVSKVNDKQVLKAFEQFVDFLKGEGYDVEEVEFSLVDEALASYYIIATAEASTNLAKYCGMRYGKEENPEGKHFDEYFSEIRGKYFGEEVKRRIILGSFVRMAGYRDAYYLKALKVRTKVIEEFKKAFKRYDVLLAPTMPILPPKIKDAKDLKPHEVYALDVLTVPVNLAGVPHVNVPVKTSSLPAGVHLIGDHGYDAELVSFAYWIEQNYRGIFK